MDPAVLIDPDFWADPTPVSPSVDAPDLAAHPELAGQVLFPTSGSSGNPKWIALTKLALLSSAEAVNRHLGVDAESCWGLALPVHHVGGFGVAARAYQAGCGFSISLRKWNPQHCLEWLNRSRVTHLSLVPTQVVDFVRKGLRAPESLQVVVVGGGRLEPLQGCAARALGWPVLASFGMTEAASQIATQPCSALNEPYQIAPLPILPIWQTQLNAQGCLEIAGSALFSGILEPSSAGWIYRPRSGEWFETNDLVQLDEFGLTPLARRDRVVKILGELVNPDQIEEQLRSLAAESSLGQAFVVLALPDERAGHRLLLVADRSIPSDVLNELFSAYNCRAPGCARISEVIQIEQFTVGEMGKPKRQELFDRIIRQEKSR